MNLYPRFEPTTLCARINGPMAALVVFVIEHGPSVCVFLGARSLQQQYVARDAILPWPDPHWERMLEIGMYGDVDWNIW